MLLPKVSWLPSPGLLILVPVIEMPFEWLEISILGIVQAGKKGDDPQNNSKTKELIGEAEQTG